MQSNRKMKGKKQNLNQFLGIIDNISQDKKSVETVDFEQESTIEGTKEYVDKQIDALEKERLQMLEMMGTTQRMIDQAIRNDREAKKKEAARRKALKQPPLETQMTTE